MMPFRISVPASSANLGPGFDSMGLALGLYIHLDVEASDQHAFFAHGSEKSQENHFIWNITEQVAARYGAVLPPAKCRKSVKYHWPEVWAAVLLRLLQELNWLISWETCN